MNKTLQLIPYWILNFTIGFGWFSLAPLVPHLMSQFSAGESAIIELISVYGYTMVAFALLSGYLSARHSVSYSLILSAVISSVGLFLRAFSGNYEFLLIAQVVAAVAYPLALGPVGSIAQSLSPRRSHTMVGISVGVLFLGMSMGSFLTPSLFALLGGIHGVFLLDAGLSLIALISLPLVLRGYPRDYAGKSLKGVFKAGMVKNWYVGLIISSISVMFGGIAASELISHSFSFDSAVYFSGIMSGLSFLGSALGAIILPPLFESLNRVRTGMVVTSLVAFASVVALSYSLSYTSAVNVLMASYFLFGFFGNAYWSMAMTSTTRYVTDPAQAGFSTSMYSVATNLGVAFIPVFLGPFFSSNALSGVIIVSAALVVAFAISFFLMVSARGTAKTGGSEGAAQS